MKERITYVWCETVRRYVAPTPAPKVEPKKKPAPNKPKAAK